VNIGTWKKKESSICRHDSGGVFHKKKGKDNGKISDE
jgi:hypothetical protein